jgi:hypothetical protein
MPHATYKRREVVTLGTDAATGKRLYSPVFSIQNALSVRLKKVMAVNMFYNVIAGVNDQFQWLASDAASKSATIPPGKYDHLSFATAFDTAVNFVSSLDTFTTTYNLNTGEYTITTDNAITPQWVSGSASATNVARIMGYFNDTTSNETSSTSHTSNFPSQLIPPYFLIKSAALRTGSASSGGGGGLQYFSEDEPAGSARQDIFAAVPNQADGSFSTFLYLERAEGAEETVYNDARQIGQVDLEFVHPYYPTVAQNLFYSTYNTITYELEFTCLSRFK